MDQGVGISIVALSIFAVFAWVMVRRWLRQRGSSSQGGSHTDAPPPESMPGSSKHAQALELFKQRHASAKAKMQTLQDEVEDDPQAVTRTFRRMMKDR